MKDSPESLLKFADVLSRNCRQRPKNDRARLHDMSLSSMGWEPRTVSDMAVAAAAAVAAAVVAAAAVAAVAVAPWLRRILGGSAYFTSKQDQ